MRVALALAGGVLVVLLLPIGPLASQYFDRGLFRPFNDLQPLPSCLSLHSRDDKFAFDELERYILKPLCTSAYFINLPIRESA